VRVNGSGGASGTRPYTVRVALMLAPLTLPNGITGVPYSRQLTISAGGVQPFSFRVAEGALPPGLSLAAGGLIGGTPTRAGTFSFGIVAGDSRGAEGRFTYGLAVGWPTLTFQTQIAPATSDRPSRRRLSVSGGTAPYTWMLAEGAVLPPGLRLGRDGVLRGTPSARAGTYTFEVTVTDAYGAPGRATFTLELRAAVLLVRPTGLVPARVGRLYDAQLRAGGGKAPYSFSRVGGRLPAGLRLGLDGRLLGKPLVAGRFAFTVQATDANGASRTRDYVLWVRRAT
jgi:Putative Ig domain